jgi:hypothetical protein
MPDHGEAASGDDIDQESMMELISETERQSYVNSTIQDKNKNNGKRPLVGIRKNAGNYEYDTKEFSAEASGGGDEKIVTNGIKKKTAGQKSKSLVSIATEMQKRREEFDLPRK